MGLQERIEELWERGEVEAEPIEQAIDLLDRGELRVASPTEDGWVVNEWAKKAILLYFRLKKVEPMDVGGLRFLDKIPVKRVDPSLGVRVVPPARCTSAPIWAHDPTDAHVTTIERGPTQAPMLT